MARTTTRPRPVELHGGAEPLVSCPGCRTGRLRFVEAADDVCFECNACGARWRQELGYIWPVM